MVRQQFADCFPPCLESGEFCVWPKLNTRGYPCTLGVPTASVLQKGYPLAQAHCTAFTSPPVVFMCVAVAPDQTAMAACTAPRRCADCVGNTTENDRQSLP